MQQEIPQKEKKIFIEKKMGERERTDIEIVSICIHFELNVSFNWICLVFIHYYLQFWLFLFIDIIDEIVGLHVCLK